jgi:hypothetical protein
VAARRGACITSRVVTRDDGADEGVETVVRPHLQRRLAHSQRAERRGARSLSG